MSLLVFLLLTVAVLLLPPLGLLSVGYLPSALLGLACVFIIFVWLM